MKNIKTVTSQSFIYDHLTNESFIMFKSTTKRWQENIISINEIIN